MIKRLIFGVGALLFFSGLSYAQSQSVIAPQVQNVGATSSGTVVSVNVSTVPKAYPVVGTSSYTASGINFFLPDSQVLQKRIQMEIFNDSAVDIWCGYNSSVSTWTQDNNYGRRIPSGTAWAHDCSIEQHWLVAGSSTGFRVVITQEK